MEKNCAVYSLCCNAIFFFFTSVSCFRLCSCWYVCLNVLFYLKCNYFTVYPPRRTFFSVRYGSSISAINYFSNKVYKVNSEVCRNIEPVYIINVWICSLENEVVAATMLLSKHLGMNLNESYPLLPAWEFGRI